MQISYPTPFFGNFFCLMEIYNAAFVAISKNAVTSLKNIVLQTKMGCIPKTDEETHAYIGFTPENGFLVPISDMPDYERTHGKLLKFAVWRDPVERLIANYKWFIRDGEWRNYFNYLALYTDNSPQRFMDFVQFELQKSHVLFQDEHLRRQSDYYQPADVDYIVPIERLNAFLATYQIPVLSKIYNQSRPLADEEFAPYKNTIRQLYQRDYELMKSEKVWHESNLETHITL